MVRGCRVHLQLHQSLHPIPERHRRALGLGDFARLGEFKSRVAGIGPQIGFFFPIADREGYLNLRGYYEFNASNRLGGWTAYVTFSVEAAEQKSAQPKLPRVTSLPR